MRRFILMGCAAWLSSCSVAALVQQNSFENRLTALETRVHTLEVPK